MKGLIRMSELIKMICLDGKESRAAISSHFRMGSPYLLRFVTGNTKEPNCFAYLIIQGESEKTTEWM